MKKILSVLLVLAMALSLVACTTEKPVETTGTPVETTAPTQAPETTAAPTETQKVLEGTMKVVATSEAYVELFEKFTAETGVKVELLSMSSGEVLSKLRAEGGTPSADLWFGGGVDAFMAAKEDGLLEQELRRCR